jgi:hypothetical protein
MTTTITSERKRHDAIENGGSVWRDVREKKMRCGMLEKEQ